MKTIFELKKIVLFLFVAIFAASCSKDDAPVAAPIPKSNTVVDVALSDSKFSSLVAALTKADLVKTLKGDGPFTVFAPTNDAFAAFLKTNGFANLDAVPVDALKQILLNHVVSSAKLSSELSTQYIKTLASGPEGAKISMFVNNNASNLKLNGLVNVTAKDIKATNGVVHVVDAVIDLPTLDVLASVNSDLSILLAQLKDAGVDLKTDKTIGIFTIFAPTNAALADFQANIAEFSDLLATRPTGFTPDDLKKIFSYHIVSGNVLAGSLTEGQVVNTLLKQTFTVQLKPSAQITDFRKRISKITDTDIQGTNGVMHIINKVLVPSLD